MVATKLADRLDEVPEGEVWIYCASGYRASVAASILDEPGRQVVLINDDYEAATAAGLARARPSSTWLDSVSTGSTSSTAGSPPTRPPSVPATPPWCVAGPAGRWNGRSASSPAHSSWPGSASVCEFPAGRLRAAGIGAGLTVSAMTDTCTLGRLLAALPYNRGQRDRTPDQVLAPSPGPALGMTGGRSRWIKREADSSE